MDFYAPLYRSNQRANQHFNGPFQHPNQRTVNRVDNSVRDGSLGPLSDDCLIHLFDNFDFFDSLTLARAYKRLDDIFRAHIVQRKLLRFDQLCEIFGDWLNGFEFICSRYGDQLRHLHINSGSMDQEIFNRIKKYKLENLRTLTLEKMSIEPDYVRQLANTWKQLQLLNISYCEISDTITMRDLLSRCSNLEAIQLQSYNFSELYMRHQLDPLLRMSSNRVREISIHYCAMDIDRSKLRHLLAKHPNLESFSYIEKSARQIVHHFDVIAERQPKLQHLGYVIKGVRRADGFEHLKSLKHLKSLNVTAMPSQEPHVIDFLNSVASRGLLEALTLHGDHVDYTGRQVNQNLVSALSSVHSLRKLSLSYGAHTMNELIQYARNMPFLEKITVKCSYLSLFWLNRSTLLELLTEAKQLRELSFHIDHQFDYLASMHLVYQCQDIVRQRPDSKAQTFNLNFCTYGRSSAFIGELVQITKKECKCFQ